MELTNEQVASIKDRIEAITRQLFAEKYRYFEKKGGFNQIWN